MELSGLIDLQKAILDDYLHNVWTTFGMYLLAIGWIITSDKSRSFLLTNRAARVAVRLAAVLILVIEIGILFFLQHRSESLYHYIQTCDLFKLYDKQDASQTSALIVLEIHRITILFPIISSIIAAILCFTFISMIVHLKESRNTVGQAVQ
jgi:ABC-type phosphate transport system permease subunit